MSSGVSTESTTAAVATAAVVEQYARELVRKGGTTRALALRAAPVWTGPERLVVSGQRVLVRPCVSALAIREALLERGADEWLVVLTDRPAEDLDLAVLGRMLHQQIEPINVWHAVPGMFDAATVAPDLRSLGGWVPTALVEHRPSAGYPAAPAGVVTRDHALQSLSASLLGLPVDRIDPAGLLAWTLDAPARDGWRAVDPAVRAGVTTWAGEALGPVAAVALDVATGPGALDAVTIGLAADVLWPESGEVPAEGVAARVRLEPLVGGRTWDLATARAVAGAARAYTLRLGGEVGEAGVTRSALLARAEALLDDLGWATGATTSTVLPAGYDTRLLALAAALRSANAAGVEAALADFLAHDAARLERADATRRAEMAVRLHRWLATADADAADLQAGLARQAGDDAWVDRAYADLWSGSTVPEVSAAYAQLCEQVAARRTGHDRSVARLLSEATSRGLLPDATLPLEHLLPRLVLPMASAGGVLLVVVDGMSAAVAGELSDGALLRGWTECVPADSRARVAALAVLPTLTRYSRTSLLSGELRDGTQSDEKRLFMAVAGGPVFHKDDLRSGAGEQLPLAVREAVAAATPVVAVVLNTVDDALAKHDPGGTDWTVESVQHLAALLDLAAAAGRSVVLTSDHGHVVERGGTARMRADADTRFRPADAPPSDDEILLTGARVLAPGGSVVAAVDEGLRYGNKAAGYHGGASTAEITVPVIVLAQDPSALASLGWVPAPPQAPRWWYEHVSPTFASAADEHLSTSKRRPAPKQEEALFGAEVVLPPATPSRADGARERAMQVVATEVFAAQRARAGRGGLDDAVVSEVLTTLLRGQGRAHRDLVAAAAGVPAARFGPTFAALRRLLNVEGYDVVALDLDGVTVLLDDALLAEQFGLGRPG